MRVAWRIGALMLLTGSLLTSATPQGNAVGGTSPVHEQIGPPASTQHWRQSFDQTFHGSRLDRSTWATCYDWACTNPTQNELEWYTGSNVTVSRGAAHLVARSQSLFGRNYTSGMIQSDHHFVFRYGYMAVRARVPSGTGFWSAFWTLPYDHDWPPEIDVVEVYGRAPNQAVLTVHYGNSDHVIESIYDGPNFSRGYHVFGVDWEPNSLTWYIDGTQVAQADVAISTPEYLLADLAISGSTPPTNATAFPSSLDIKWIRVWQHPGQQSWDRQVAA
jgi:beta-glucanase (GH16 family)